MSNPVITVVMPAYNAAKYVSEAIESILNQTYEDFEFIIIDDCSTDNTWHIIQEYETKDERIVAVRNDSNLRICKTLNTAIGMARGKYIARMDADDWAYRNRLEKQCLFMESHPDVAVSGGNIEICDDRMKVINERSYPIDDENIRKILFKYSPFCHPATIWRTEILRKVGGYNEAFTVAQDIDLYFRAGRESKFGNLADTILKLRTHDNSSSLTSGREQELFTLFIRLKAIVEYGYRMTFLDKLYFASQYMSMFLVPQRIKFWLFNFLRKYVCAVVLMVIS